MSKHLHRANSGKAALTHGRKEHFGPFTNLRHRKRIEPPKPSTAPKAEDPGGKSAGA